MQQGQVPKWSQLPLAWRNIGSVTHLSNAERPSSSSCHFWRTRSTGITSYYHYYYQHSMSMMMRFSSMGKFLPHWTHRLFRGESEVVLLLASGTHLLARHLDVTQSSWQMTFYLLMSWEDIFTLLMHAAIGWWKCVASSFWLKCLRSGTPNRALLARHISPGSWK